MIPKLISLDIDGTILGSDDMVSDRLVAILDRAQKAGTRIALATGRPYFAAKHIIERLPVNAPSMFLSGAYILDVHTEEEFLADCLEKPLCDRFLELAATYNWYAELYDRKDFYVEGPHPYLDIHMKYLRQSPLTIDFEKVRAGDYLKGVYILPASEAKATYDLIQNELPDSTIALSYAAQDMQIAFFNISSSRASREKAFQIMTDLTSIQPEELLAFGDAESDIPFLKLAGVGVAMGNAPDSVKNSADFITLSAEEDGVAAYLEKIF